jgi:endoglucanase
LLFLCQLEIKIKLSTKYIAMKKVGFILLFSLIMTGLAFAQKPAMEFQKTEHNFGTIKEEIGAVTTQFTFKNTGDAPIIIQRVSSSCGCTTPSYTRQPILPGKEGTISAQYSTVRRPGTFNKTIRVYTNIPDTVYVLTIKWVITPNVVEDWLYTPVVQTSQVGYHPNQPKVAVIELDKKDIGRDTPVLYKITSDGVKEIFKDDGKKWGEFLRYSYLKFDFSDIKEEGLYQVIYGDSKSSIFRISKDIYDRGVWQPVLEYFLPVQMCHMRVNEKYRVWHDLCHFDDARMAPVDFNHIDGYVQGPSTLTKFNPGDFVPGLNIGGWHDAGDFDLRVESQAGETYILTLAYEAFNVDYDVTTIDQHSRITEIHQPDGKPDLLQQIENGTLSVVGAYRSLGRLYRGIITNSLRDYVLLGDASAMTDNEIGNNDDRWVFTENNPARELTTAANVAAASRALKGFNDTLSIQAIECAKEIYEITEENNRSKSAKVHAAVELYLTTGDVKYKEWLLKETDYIVKNINSLGWFLGRAEKRINDTAFSKAIEQSLHSLKNNLDTQAAETPYGIPYRPHIWGAGWNIQEFGFKHYFLHKSYPDIFGTEYIYNALNFILGCHPGSNTASFASGIGVNSATVGYGLNRADWSYIPGGVISGTALIRPDFPELLEFPFLWQQVEYVMGGGSSHYMFLVLAAQQLLTEQ